MFSFSTFLMSLFDKRYTLFCSFYSLPSTAFYILSLFHHSIQRFAEFLLQSNTALLISQIQRERRIQSVKSAGEVIDWNKAPELWRLREGNHSSTPKSPQICYILCRSPCCLLCILWIEKISLCQNSVHVSIKSVPPHHSRLSPSVGHAVSNKEL